MPHFERHVFICTNRREPGNPKGDCASKGSDAIREAFKKGLHERGLKGRMRANAAGCLDQCAYGPTVVVYPEQVWYTVPTPADAEEIIEQHLINGVPVERLFLRTAKEQKQAEPSAGAKSSEAKAQDATSSEAKAQDATSSEAKAQDATSSDAKAQDSREPKVTR